MRMDWVCLQSSDSFSARIKQWLCPDFSHVSILRRYEISFSVVFGNKYALTVPLSWYSAGSQFRERGMLGGRLVLPCGALNWSWLRRIPRLNPASPALHIVLLLTQVELCLKLLPSFTYLLWKGLRRGWENEFGMECGGKLKASAATVVYFLSFSETRAMHN